MSHLIKPEFPLFFSGADSIPPVATATIFRCIHFRVKEPDTPQQRLCPRDTDEFCTVSKRFPEEGGSVAWTIFAFALGVSYCFCF
jgi:hypothetical protein